MANSATTRGQPPTNTLNEQPPPTPAMAILEPIYNLPNHVIEKQKMYQNSTKPIMLRGPRGGLYVGTFGVLFAVGMASTVYAFGSLIVGNKKAE
ncbi:hypothetical protein BJ912DRAFT_1051950 [Pholiota molesta]|nr:hypothetical protein BJ912DRAFT_1051950 [Pholiota molesta]